MSKAPSLFASRRERRLWAWTLAIVVAIYSTLGLAATLAEALRNRGLLGVAFALCFLLVLATVAAHGLTTRRGGAEIVVLLGIAAVYGLVLVRMTIPTVERTHLIEYGVVAVFIHEALRERAAQGRRVPTPALLAALAASLFGVVDECIQGLVPGRSFQARDILVNVLAAVMAVTAGVALGWARRRF